MNTKYELDQLIANGGGVSVSISNDDQFEVKNYTLVIREMIIDLHKLHKLPVEQCYVQIHDQFEKYITDQVCGYHKLFCPIYFFTYLDKERVVFKDGVNESIVYIGKTNSTKNRFKNGHRATQTLLEEWFNAMEKRLYFAQVWVQYIHNGREYNAPLEWLKPLKIVEDIITYLEYFFIYQEKPFVNMDGIDTRIRKTNYRSYSDYCPTDDINGFKIIMDPEKSLCSPYLEDLGERITREAIQDMYKEVLFGELESAIVDDDYEE